MEILYKIGLAWKRADVYGRVSRSVRLGEVLMALGMLDGILGVAGLPVPEEYRWVTGVVLVVSGRLQIYLRAKTDTPMP